MTSAEKILLTLDGAGPLCDDCLSEASGVTPRQQVNQRCRELAEDGEITRGHTVCTACGETKLVNEVGAVSGLEGAGLETQEPGVPDVELGDREFVGDFWEEPPPPGWYRRSVRPRQRAREARAAEKAAARKGGIFSRLQMWRDQETVEAAWHRAAADTWYAPIRLQAHLT